MQVTILPGLANSQADTHQEICEAPCEILEYCMYSVLDQEKVTEKLFTARSPQAHA